jgi:hypothetical protein
MQKIKRITCTTGTQEWTTENYKYGVSIFPFEPNKLRSRCNEICVWSGAGYSGAATSCTIKGWLERTEQGNNVRRLVDSSLGSGISAEIDEFLKNS